MKSRLPFNFDVSRSILSEDKETDAFIRRMMVVATLVAILVGAIVGAAIYSGYQQRMQQAAITVENLSWVLQESLFGVVGMADQALLAVSDEASRQAAAGGINGKTFNAFIERKESQLPRSDGLRVTSADGSTNYGTDVKPGATNVRGRDYFIQLKTDPNAGLVVSKPLISQISGKWAVIFARRHNRPDGSFNGVALLPINLETIAQDFAAVDVGPNGLIALLGENARIIVRKPEPDGVGSAINQRVVSPKIQELVRTGVRTGVYSSRSSIDGTERVLSARKIAGYPLYVAVGLDPRDFLADWRRDAVMLIASWLVFSLLLMILSVMLMRGWRHRVTTLRTQELNLELEAKVAERTHELEVINHKLEELTTIDGLTGIANRRRFDQAIAQEWSRASRTGQSIALMMFDIDYFKRYNDHYGHVQGDDCLRKVASLLDHHGRRPGDLVARYGGEEFVILVPAIDAVTALGIAKTICESVAKMAAPHTSSPFKIVTISAGVAALIPTAGAAPETLVNMADEALYNAKGAGRNRALSWSGSKAPAS